MIGDVNVQLEWGSEFENLGRISVEFTEANVIEIEIKAVVTETILQ